MEMFGLVDALNEYCIDNGYTFIYGSKAFANAQLDPKKYLPNELIVIADFTITPNYNDSSRVQTIQYKGGLMVGQKCEVLTKSNLDETPMQKYQLRLKELTTILTDMVGELACINELSILSMDLRFDLNQFDLNADFVAATLTLEQ